MCRFTFLHKKQRLSHIPDINILIKLCIICVHPEGLLGNYRMVRNPAEEGPSCVYTGEKPNYEELDANYVAVPIKKGQPYHPLRGLTSNNMWWASQHEATNIFLLLQTDKYELKLAENVIHKRISCVL